MFLINKYTRWYNSIINSASHRTINGYVEKHHIIPKCIGGLDNPENLVKLTAREHFICHWLLTKMTADTPSKYKMWNAFSCMLYRATDAQHRYQISSKIFENIKKEGAKIKSIRFSGKNNPMYGIRGPAHHAFGKKSSELTKQKQSIAHLGVKRSAEAREKQSKSSKGRKQTPEHIEKRSGKNSAGYGKPISDDIKEKIRQSILMLPLCTCEHCGKITNKGNYKRWHGINCKQFVIQGG